MKSLVGRKLLGVTIDDFGILNLDFEDRPESYSAQGDCCSRSWFEVNEDLVEYPATILEVDDIPLNTVRDDNRYDVLKSFGFKIKTTGGYLDIILRNDSNGYYGGYIVDQRTYKEDYGYYQDGSTT